MPLPGWATWGLLPSGIRLTQVVLLAGGPELKPNTTPTHREASNNQDKAILAQPPILSTQQLDTSSGEGLPGLFLANISVPELHAA